jgi:hypothetical protein
LEKKLQPKERKNRMQQTKGRRQTKMEVEIPLFHYNTLKKIIPKIPKRKICSPEQRLHKLSA